ncbi:MAG: hypothetical protein NTW31_12780 [Bacteroidetes bacterium]|nr:hypothetical protein [Bacteroidota bacterium]
MTEQISDIPEKLINVEGLFAAKNPRLLKFIPGWFMRYVKRIIHQDEVNGYIFRNRDKFGLPFVEAILGEFGVTVKTEIAGIKAVNPFDSLREIISDSRLIIASNHPLGGLDGLALMNQIGKVRPDIVFPVNDLLMNIPGLQPLFIPINKHGKNTENSRIIDETFAGSKT